MRRPPGLQCTRSAHTHAHTHLEALGGAGAETPLAEWPQHLRTAAGIGVVPLELIKPEQIAQASQRAIQRFPANPWYEHAQVGATGLFQNLYQLYLGVDGPNVVNPGRRTQWEEDFVELKQRLTPKQIQKAQQQWQGFMARVPDYAENEHLYQGRGVVICGGGLRYMTAVWVNVHMLRRHGCTLPIELWFYSSEMPRPAMQKVLLEMGVFCRNVEDLFPGGAQTVFKSYRIKAAALLFSQFKEVLFLDADIVSVEDPTFLFELKEYKETGAIFWPDFWGSSMAPDFLNVTGLTPDQIPLGTTESGQMVLNKQQSWKSLLLALFFNLQGELYYPLMTDYMGLGDKETFPLAHLVLRQPYHFVDYAVGVVGIHKTTKVGQNPLFSGNTMIQHRPDRQPQQNNSILFLHANSPKMAVALPNDFADFQRRWQVLMELEGDSSQPSVERPFEEATRYLGFDIERTCFEMIRLMRCSTFFEDSLADWIRLDKEVDVLPGDGRSHGWFGSVGGIQFEWMKEVNSPFRPPFKPWRGQGRDRNPLYSSPKHRRRCLLFGRFFCRRS